jgi:hypothetical protein
MPLEPDVGGHGWRFQRDDGSEGEIDLSSSEPAWPRPESRCVPSKSGIGPGGRGSNPLAHPIQNPC